MSYTVFPSELTYTNPRKPAFIFPFKGAQLWVPLVLDRVSITDRSGHYLTVIGRVRAGIGLPQVLAEMDVVSERWASDYEHAHPLNALAMKEQLVGDVRTLLFVLLGTVGLVLLIACVNVASLFLARAEGRQKEMAIRTALGAGRARLLSQTLAESLVLALVGGALGLLFAVWGVDVLLSHGCINTDLIDPRKVTGFHRVLSRSRSQFCLHWPSAWFRGYVPRVRPWAPLSYRALVRSVRARDDHGCEASSLSPKLPWRWCWSGLHSLASQLLESSADSAGHRTDGCTEREDFAAGSSLSRFR